MKNIESDNKTETQPSQPEETSKRINAYKLTGTIQNHVRAIAANMDKLFIRYAAYWFNRDITTFNWAFSEKVSLSQVTNCEKPYLDNYEVVDYLVNTTETVFKQCNENDSIELYNQYVSQLTEVISDEKYNDLFPYGTKMYLLDSLHLDMLNTNTILDVAKFSASLNYTIWSCGELKILYKYLSPEKQQICVSYYGQKYNPTLDETIDIDGLYSKWLSCKKSNIEFKSEMIDEYKTQKESTSTRQNISTQKTEAFSYISTKTDNTNSKTSQNNNHVSAPNKPVFKGGYIAGVVLGVVLFLLGIPLLNQSESECSYSMAHGNGNPHFYAIFLFLSGIAIVAVTIGFFVRNLSRYNLYKNDINAYRKMINEENLRAAQNCEAQRQAEESRLAKLPECPICKSKANVKRISSLDRSMSVAMIGLASSKIGKQYECTKCKHKF